MVGLNRISGWVVCWSLVATCGSGGEPGTCDNPSGSTRIRFDVSPGGVLPFPADPFTRDDPDTPTGVRLDLPVETTPVVAPGVALLGGTPEQMVAALNRLDGFSVKAPVLFALSGPIDPDSLPDSPEESLASEASVFLANVDPESSDFGSRVPVRVEALQLGDDHLLSVTPVVPLTGATRYAVVVLTSVRTARGGPLGPSTDFVYACGRCQTPDDHPQPDRIERWRAGLEILFDSPFSLEPAGLAGATFFTTQTVQADLEAMLEELTAQVFEPADLDRDDDGTPDLFLPLDSPDAPQDALEVENVDRVLKGSFHMSEFRDEQGVITFDSRGRTEAVDEVDIAFLLYLPADPQAQPCPVVVMQHGLYTRKEFALYVAGYLARRGLATIAIDLAEHGEGPRRGSAFIAPTDLRLTAGNFLQSAADLVRLVQVVENDLADIDLMPEGTGDGVADLDTSRIGYLGSSAGAMVGTLVLARVPTIQHAVLTVGGGGFDNLAWHYFGNLYAEEDFLPFTVLTQTCMDRSDPFGFAHDLSLVGGAGTQILMHQVMNDVIMPEAATEDLARALNCPLIRPFQQAIDGLTAVDAPTTRKGMFQFHPAGHGFLLADDEHPEASLGAREQAARFLESALKEGLGVIEAPTVD